MTEEFTKGMENFRKKVSKKNPGNKNFLKSNKKYSGKPFQQTRKVEDRSWGLKTK
jgi:hypothetical protein